MSTSSRAARSWPKRWPRSEQLLAAAVALAAVALVLAGAGYAIAQAGLFLWFGEWLSPVDAIALLQPAVRDLGWIADPQQWRGLHVVVTSAWFGPITVAGGLAVACLARVIGIATHDQ